MVQSQEKTKTTKIGSWVTVTVTIKTLRINILYGILPQYFEQADSIDLTGQQTS